MLSVIRGADFFSGLRFRIARVGGSVARARAAKVSMIRFTHNNWTGGTDSSSEDATAETNVRRTAVMLTVSWNYGLLAFNCSPQPCL